MDVETALREIDEANHKHVGDEYDDRRDEYREALEAAADLAGGDAVDDVTRFIAGHIREEGEHPSVDEVDEHAAEAVRDHGGEVPVDSRLGPA